MSLINNPEFECSDPSSEILQEQEHVERVMELG